MTGRIDPKPTIKSFRYVDDSRTGVYEIDSRHIYIDFELLQRLLEMQAVPRVDDEGNETGKIAPARASQVQIKLKPGVDSEAISERLTETYLSLAADKRFELTDVERDLFDRLEARPWQETQAHIIGPIQKEKMLVTILFGIISMVAVALILCILYMIVLQKTRDIGILKAVGGSSGGVATIWVGYGMCVGVVGAILGTILGTVFVYNLNNIQDLLIEWFGIRVWDMKVYSFDSIPQEVDPVDAAAIAMIAIAASTLGALGAARRAALMEPVESIRHE
jgi:lipoprotein-releasing system permease protein